MTITIAKSDLTELTKPRFILFALSIMGVYSAITLLLPNYRLFSTVITNHDATLTKLSFLISLIVGSFFSYNTTELFLLLLTGFLIGLNLRLWLTRRHNTLAATPLLGGQSLAGVVSSGCSSCGSTILSVVSSTLGVGIAPIHLLFIQLLTIAFLFFSFLYTLQKKNVCSIPSRS